MKMQENRVLLKINICIKKHLSIKWKYYIYLYTMCNLCNWMMITSAILYTKKIKIDHFYLIEPLELSRKVKWFCKNFELNTNHHIIVKKLTSNCQNFYSSSVSVHKVFFNMGKLTSWIETWARPVTFLGIRPVHEKQ